MFNMQGSNEDVQLNALRIVAGYLCADVMANFDEYAQPVSAALQGNPQARSAFMTMRDDGYQWMMGEDENDKAAILDALVDVAQTKNRLPSSMIQHMTAIAGQLEKMRGMRSSALFWRHFKSDGSGGRWANPSSTRKLPNLIRW